MVTPIQQRIYEFVSDHVAEAGYSPSLTEIARGIGISPKSISLISRNIHALVAAGRLSFHKKGYRNITVSKPAALPLLGRIAAGSPIEAIPEPDSLDLAPILSQ